MFRIARKIGKILNKQQKVRVVILGILMFIGGLLETVSASLMIPLITAVMDEKLFQNNRYARLFCEIFDINSNQTFVVAILLGLMGMYLLKNAFLLFQIYVQNRFISNNKFSTKSQMLELYLSRPYSDFLNLSTAQISRAVQGNVDGAYAAISTTLSFFTEFVTAVILVSAIVALNPQIALSIAALLLALMLVIVKVIKPFIKKMGMSFMENATKCNKWFLQAVNGIKELKVARKEEYFLAQYNRYGKKMVKAERDNNVLGNVPRLLIEAICMCGILGIMAVMLYKGADIMELLPQLSAFAVAVVRLLPCANRISGYMTAVAFQEPQLDEMIKNQEEILKWKEADEKKKAEMLLKEAKERKEKKSKKLFGQKSKSGQNGSAESTLTIQEKIELSNVLFAYPNAEVNVLEHADMEIPVGKSIGVVGSSGAGKTTVVDLLLGLLEAQEGQIKVDGKNIYNDYEYWLSQIGYIPQMIYMLDDTIRANVGFGYAEEEIDDEQVWRALEEAQLKDFVEGLPEGIDTVIGERGVRVSGGQRQRIGIARALYENPQILFFDEATSALDNETEAAIMESINSLHGKKTMIIIAHRLTTIEGCDMVYRVGDGKVVRER